MNHDLDKTVVPRHVDPRSRNAVKHGLTARHVLDEEMEAYRAALAELQAQEEPEGPVEAALVERIAMLCVRVRRAAQIEAQAHARCYGEDGSVDLLAFQHVAGNIGRYELALGRALAKAQHELERLKHRRGIGDDPGATVIDFNW